MSNRRLPWSTLGTVLRTVATVLIWTVGYGLASLSGVTGTVSRGLIGVGGVVVSIAALVIWDWFWSEAFDVVTNRFEEGSVRQFYWGFWEIFLWASVVVGIYLALTIPVSQVLSVTSGNGLRLEIGLLELVHPTGSNGLSTVLDVLISFLVILPLTLLGTYIALVQLKNRIYTMFMSGNTRRIIDELGFLPGPKLFPDVNVVVSDAPVFWYGGHGEPDDECFPPDDDRHEDDLELVPGRPNLVYFRFKYNDGDPRERKSLLRPVFPMFRWWIHFPDGFRVLRRSDAKEDGIEGYDHVVDGDRSGLSDWIEPNGDTLDTYRSSQPDDQGREETFATANVLINDHSKDGGAYDNIAFGYHQGKLFVLTRNQIRGEVEYFGTGHNKRIHIPVWVVPERHEERDGRIRVSINASEYPHYQIYNEFEISFVD